MERTLISGYIPMFTVLRRDGLKTAWIRKALMAVPLDKLEGRKFCVVFVKVIDAATERVQLQCMRGRASVERGRVSCVDANGSSFQIPSISVKNILPSDGTALLKDAEYFCLVKLDESIELVNKDVDDAYFGH